MSGSLGWGEGFASFLVVRFMAPRDEGRDMCAALEPTSERVQDTVAFCGAVHGAAGERLPPRWVECWCGRHAARAPRSEMGNAFFRKRERAAEKGSQGESP